MFLFKSQGKKIIILIFVLLLPILYTRYSSLLNYDSLTFLRREELMVTATKLFLKNPLFGVGLNNFIPTGADLLLSGPSRFLQPVHNIFLLTLSETGIIGFIGLIILIGYPIITLLKLNPKPYPLNPRLLIWGLIIFLGMFDHYFLTLPQGYRLLFLVWGLSTAYSNDRID
jgi:O-antigen ligase